MQKRTTVILGSMLLCAGLLFAQAPGSDQQQPATPQTGPSAPMQYHRPGMRAQWLARRLNLSQDQVEQIKPILAEQRQQMQALRADTAQSVQSFRDKAKAIRQDTQGKIEALLNDSQKQQFEQMLAARRARHQQQQPAQTQPGI